MPLCSESSGQGHCEGRGEALNDEAGEVCSFKSTPMTPVAWQQQYSGVLLAQTVTALLRWTRRMTDPDMLWEEHALGGTYSSF